MLVNVPGEPLPDIAPAGPSPNNKPTEDGMPDPTSTPGEETGAGWSPIFIRDRRHTDGKDKRTVHNIIKRGCSQHSYWPEYCRTTRAGGDTRCGDKSRESLRRPIIVCTAGANQ